VLELDDISLRLGHDSEGAILLSEINIALPTKGHFAAILGPSGCGKSTLLKVIAGLSEPTAGIVRWEGRDLAKEGDLDPQQVGYVPQFGVAYEFLTVRESVSDALRLRLSTGSEEERHARALQILTDVGLTEIADRRIKVLSGGQKRRLALALELVSSPHLLLCDEVTSGLDPKAEDEIAHLLAELSRSSNRLVLSVTHSLRHLSLCDSVIVLFHGHAVFHGAPDHLFHYFGVEKHEDLFPTLARRPAEQWHASWMKHRLAYYAQSGLPGDGEAAQPSPSHPESQPQAVATESPSAPLKESESTHATHVGSERPIVVDPQTPIPGALPQLAVLLRRRVRIFFRDRGNLLLQLALLFGFPCLVVIFALDGLPQLKSLAVVPGANFVQQLQSDISQRVDTMRTGSLVSGLVMFQVILLALMGSNNGAREVAGERLIFEKEKFAGLRPAAYVLSKFIFLTALVIAQSVWMGIFVHFVVGFPGAVATQLLLLTLVNGAVTFMCLAISSWLRTAEQSSLLSVYLVGFQLPLSGAVLTMPAALEPITRWFIGSYWAWAGYLQTLRDTRFFTAVQQVTQTHLAELPLCLMVLGAHILLGLYLTLAGCRNPRWD
jgi:ABC-type multidrug transport system ATPase subunit